MPSIACESRILDLLDSWRDLPAYQLERRADIFFAAYLPRFLEKKFSQRISDVLIPEFPLHHRSIRPDLPRRTNDSCRLDYLALSLDLADAYFIELKTDPRSRGRDQEDNMAAAQHVGFRALVDGVLKILDANTKLSAPHSYLLKYVCLLRLMAKNNLLTIPEELEQALRSKKIKSSIKACLPRIQINDVNPKITIVYLQPHHIYRNSNDVDFIEFANFLSSVSDDSLKLRFEASIRRWSKSAAGVQPITSQTHF